MCENSLGGDADDETLNWLEMDDGLQSLASTGLACYLFPSRFSFYAPQSCLLPTHFKGLPIHCVSTWSHRPKMLYIFSSVVHFCIWRVYKTSIMIVHNTFHYDIQKCELLLRNEAGMNQEQPAN